MRAPMLLGARILISAIFVQGALGKILGWEGQAAYMRSHGITHFVTPLLAAALVIEAAGVLCVLSGFRVRAAAAVMCGYLVILSVLLHDFWAAPAASAGIMQTQFLKNMAIAGGLLVLAACGSGRWSATPDAARKTIVVPAGEDRAYDEWHYAPALRTGDLIIVSGIPAARGDTYEAKVRHMFERLKRTLAAAGADLSDVVELTTFHANARDTETFQKEFAEFSRLHHEYFPSGYPAWTAVGTTALLAPGAALEMRVVAVAGAGKNTEVKRAATP